MLYFIYWLHWIIMMYEIMIFIVHNRNCYSQINLSTCIYTFLPTWPEQSSLIQTLFHYSFAHTPLIPIVLHHYYKQKYYIGMRASWWQIKLSRYAHQIVYPKLNLCTTIISVRADSLSKVVGLKTYILWFWWTGPHRGGSYDG